MRKPDFLLGVTEAQISFAVTAKLISASIFATQTVKNLYFLSEKKNNNNNNKFQFLVILVYAQLS